MNITTFCANYTATGNITPAHGKSYKHNTDDSCATVYYNHIRVYTNRRSDIPNTDCIPALFDDVERIELNDNKRI